MKRLLLLGACLALAGCSDTRAKNHANAAILLEGLTHVALSGPEFDCVSSGEPAIRKPGINSVRAGYFFKAKRGDVPVFGAVCVSRAGSGNANVKIITPPPAPSKPVL